MNALIRPASTRATVASPEPTGRGRIFRVDVLDDLAQAEPVWRSLEASGALATPYQRYDWILPWQRHVGAPSGVTPFLVVGSDADGTPLFLWPLGLTRIGPLKVGQFLGGKHTNFNLALWRRGFAATITLAEIEDVLEWIRASSRIDLLALTNQPECWDGEFNPFAKLPRQSSPSFGYRGALTSDFDALMRLRLDRSARRKMRQKQTALASRGPVRAWRARTLDDARRVLDAFFTQKAERMNELGLSDMFAIPGTREFIAAAATEGLDQGSPAIELYALSVGDIIAATYSGIVAHGRFCGIFNSIIRNELARESPGQLLLLDLVRMCCERGLTQLDLGVGEAHFKNMFCSDAEPLFDSFLPLSPLGHVAAAAYRIHHHAKRRIKHSPAIWGAVTKLRRRYGSRRQRSQ